MISSRGEVIQYQMAHDIRCRSYRDAIVVISVAIIMLVITAKGRLFEVIRQLAIGLHVSIATLVSRCCRRSIDQQIGRLIAVDDGQQSVIVKQR